MKARAFPSTSVAPWGEIVPEAGPMTVAALLRLPDDGRLYEVVEGVLVRVAGSSAEATELAMRLGGRLSVYIDSCAERY